MALSLPPFPVTAQPGDYAWVDWYRQLGDFVKSISTVSWTAIDFTGSNLADLATRNHNDLENIQGGVGNERYHLTAAQHAALGGGVSSFNTRTGAVTLQKSDVDSLYSGDILTDTSTIDITQIVGQTSTPTSGQLGEVIITSDTITTVPMTPNTDMVALSMTVPAGVWELSGSSRFDSTLAGSITSVITSVNTTPTSNTLYNTIHPITSDSAVKDNGISYIVTLTTSSTVYLIVRANSSNVQYSTRILRAIRIG